MPGKRPRFARGVRKYIRTEKARIRREVVDISKQQELITTVIKRFSPAVPIVP